MKDQLKDLLIKCIKELISKGILNEMPPKVRIDHTKDKSHGEYATNIALMLSLIHISEPTRPERSRMPSSA